MKKNIEKICNFLHVDLIKNLFSNTKKTLEFLNFFQKKMFVLKPFSNFYFLLFTLEKMNYIMHVNKQINKQYGSVTLDY